MVSGSTLWRAPRGVIMCDYKKYSLFEYSEKASKKYGYPEEWIMEKLDWLYQRIGDNIFPLMERVNELFASYNGKGSLEDYFVTSLPKEAFQ